MDYLNRQRIEQACYELSTTGDSITDIAYRNGFNDLSYFIRTFKKYKGTTPGKYNKSLYYTAMNTIDSGDFYRAGIGLMSALFSYCFRYVEDVSCSP